MKYYLINSDNFEDCMMDEPSYKELTLQMSTGDFHTHTAVILLRPTDEQINSAMYYDENEQAFLPY